MTQTTSSLLCYDAAADALKDDYSEVEYEGDTYFVRST